MRWLLNGSWHCENPDCEGKQAQFDDSTGNFWLCTTCRLSICCKCINNEEAVSYRGSMEQKMLQKKLIPEYVQIKDGFILRWRLDYKNLGLVEKIECNSFKDIKLRRVLLSLQEGSLANLFFSNNDVY